MKTREFLTSVLEAAGEYTRRGFYTVPIPLGENHPTIRAWQKMRLGLKDLKKSFSGAWGVGLLLKPSKLLDVDLDCPEAVAAAKVLLPPTGMVRGRRGNPSSTTSITSPLLGKISRSLTRVNGPEESVPCW